MSAFGVPLSGTAAVAVGHSGCQCDCKRGRFRPAAPKPRVVSQRSMPVHSRAGPGGQTGSVTSVASGCRRLPLVQAAVTGRGRPEPRLLARAAKQERPEEPRFALAAGTGTAHVIL